MRMGVRLLLLALALSAPMLAYASDDLEARLDRVMNAYVRKEHFNGSVLVSERGQVLYRKGFGLADASKSAADAPETQFLLASVTKQFVATLVLRQVERGQMRLDSP